MKALSKNAFYALAATVLMTACNRPVATYQKMPVERFTSHTTVTAPAEVASQTPEVATAPARITNQEVLVSSAQPADVAAATKSLDEAVASAEKKVAGNAKLEKRMARVRTMLAEVNAKATAPTTAMTAKKMTVAERVMLKKLDKKLNKTFAPEKTNALDRTTRAGIILGIVGLLFALLFGGVLGVLGVLALIAGVVLILVGVLNNA